MDVIPKKQCEYPGCENTFPDWYMTKFCGPHEMRHVIEQLDAILAETNTKQNPLSPASDPRTEAIVPPIPKS